MAFHKTLKSNPQLFSENFQQRSHQLNQVYGKPSQLETFEQNIDMNKDSYCMVKVYLAFFSKTETCIPVNCIIYNACVRIGLKPTLAIYWSVQNYLLLHLFVDNQVLTFH